RSAVPSAGRWVSNELRFDARRGRCAGGLQRAGVLRRSWLSWLGSGGCCGVRLVRDPGSGSQWRSRTQGMPGQRARVMAEGGKSVMAVILGHPRDRSKRFVTNDDEM